jgi:hypothetical protein
MRAVPLVKTGNSLVGGDEPMSGYECKSAVIRVVCCVKSRFSIDIVFGSGCLPAAHARVNPVLARPEETVSCCAEVSCQHEHGNKTAR